MRSAAVCPPMRFMVACVAALLALFSPNVHGQGQPQGHVVSIAPPVDGKITITYDLEGDTTAEYSVQLLLLAQGSQGGGAEVAPPVTLEHVKGDVGTGKFAGQGRHIVWDKSELPDLVEGQAYRFRIRAERTGGWPWYYWAGGAVVAGGTAALLLTKSGGPPPPPVRQIPLPPARP